MDAIKFILILLTFIILLNVILKTEFKVDEFLRLINEALSVCNENGVEFVLKLPKITSSYFLDNLKPILKHAFEAGVNGIMVDGIGAAKFIFDLNPESQHYLHLQVLIFGMLNQ